MGFQSEEFGPLTTRINTDRRSGSSRFAFGSSRKGDLVLHKLKLQAHAAAGAVIKGAELRSVKVVLHVARVPVVRDVEDRQPRASFVFLAARRNRETFRHQQ